MNNVAPSPAVEHLPTVFRKIRTGDYRIPAFQRDFVWEEKQVLELMESVYRGYPIGSILLWRVDKPVFQSIKEKSVGFPVTDEKFPSSFILDGAQRLSALNGAFASDEVSFDKRLQIYFDLDAEVFFQERDRPKYGESIPLKAVFHPRAFLSEQQRLASLPKGDHLLDRAVRLLTTFQEYMVPVVTIEGKSPKEVVDIFQRINSTGTSLGVVDFIRALTWSDKFDLTIELEKLQAHFDAVGFTLDEELLLKSLGVILGLRPLPDVLLSLRERSASDLHRGIGLLLQALETATEFVSARLSIAAADALPYEAQWLFLVRAIKEGIDLSLFQEQIEKWIKISSLFETLQGRPDHALARMVDEMVGAMQEHKWIGSPNMEISPQALISKRFMRGKATTVSFIEMLAERGLFLRTGITGPLKVVPYDSFVPIVSRERLNTISNRKLNSAKTIPNVVFLSEKHYGYRNNALKYVTDVFQQNDLDEIAILKIQFIQRAFFNLVQSGDIEGALTKRAEEIGDYAKTKWMI